MDNIQEDRDIISELYGNGDIHGLVINNTIDIIKNAITTVGINNSTLVELKGEIVKITDGEEIKSILPIKFDIGLATVKIHNIITEFISSQYKQIDKDLDSIIKLIIGLIEEYKYKLLCVGFTKIYVQAGQKSKEQIEMAKNIEGSLKLQKIVKEQLKEDNEIKEPAVLIDLEDTDVVSSSYISIIKNVTSIDVIGSPVYLYLKSKIGIRLIGLTDASIINNILRVTIEKIQIGKLYVYQEGVFKKIKNTELFGLKLDLL